MKSFLNHPLFEGLDKLLKMILFHFLFWLTLILSLGFLTYPALTILVLAIKSLSERHDSIVKTWIAHLREFIKTQLRLALFYQTLLLLFLFNTVYFTLAFQETQFSFHAILAFMNGLVFLFVMKMMQHSALLTIYFPHLTQRSILKYSLKMPIVLMASTFLTTVVFFLSIALIMVAPYLFIVVFPLAEISLLYVLTKNPYHRLLDANHPARRFDTPKTP